MIVKNITGAALLLAISLNASAASTADLDVTGTIFPAACMPTIDNNGIFDYGDISADKLIGKAEHNMGFKIASFDITCANPTLIGLVSVDQDKDSIERVQGYNTFVGTMVPNIEDLIGLGWTADGKRIGSALVVMDGGLSDQGVAVRGIVSINNGAWGNFTYGQLGGQGHRLNSFATLGDLTPRAVTNVSGRIGVSPFIKVTRSGSEDLTFEDKIDINGNLVIDMVYL